MSDFTGPFWSLFVAGVTLVSIVACALLLMSMSKRRAAGDPDQTPHVWDEDLAELNNALPRAALARSKRCPLSRRTYSTTSSISDGFRNSWSPKSLVSSSFRNFGS